MKELARHIELLLRDNNCVILPGFGGFIAYETPAHYVSEEGLYYPPSRHISFNTTITMNDGLLVQSYMKSHQIDYAHANYIVDVAVEQLTDMLDEEGCVTLPHIGTITQDIHQRLQFTPDPVGIASPMLFGLGSFFIKELSLQHSSPAATQKAKNIGSRTTKTIDLHINKETLHRVLTTVAVFLLLLMVALPVGNHRTTDVASLHLTEFIAAPQITVSEAVLTAAPSATDIIEGSDTTSTTTEVEASTAVEAPAVIESPTVEVQMETLPTATEAEAVTVETTTVEKISAKETSVEVNTVEEATAEVTTEVATIVPTLPSKTYHIIVASFPNHRGVDEELARYTNQGYTGASLIERDNRIRISLIQFTDKDEANRYLGTLRQNEKFQNAWLLAVRNN